jgi:hypothetical protein
VFGRKVVAIPVGVVTAVNENGIQAQHHQAAGEGPAVRLASIARVSSGAPPPAPVASLNSGGPRIPGVTVTTWSTMRGGVQGPPRPVSGQLSTKAIAI